MKQVLKCFCTTKNLRSSNEIFLNYRPNKEGRFMLYRVILKRIPVFKEDKLI